MKRKGKGKLAAGIPFVIFGIFITIMVLAVPVAYWVHYEEAVYEQAKVPENVVEKEIKSLADLVSIYEEEQQLNEGYWDAYSSSRDWENIYFSFEVEKEDLEPLGFYIKEYQFANAYSVGGGKYHRGGTYVSDYIGPPEYTWSTLKAFRYRTFAIFSQMYSLQLEDGSKVLLLLGDTAMKLNGKGTVKIPAAIWERLWITTYKNAQTGELHEGRTGEQHAAFLAKEAQVAKMQDGNIFYIDAADWWMNYNDDLKQACERRADLLGVMFLVGVGGIFLGVIVLVVYCTRTRKQIS